MPNVHMPDGAIVAFPDDMPPEQIKAMILQKFPGAGGPPPAPAAPAAAPAATPVGLPDSGVVNFDQYFGKQQ